MRYLRIMNRGLANPVALSTLGASTTRYSDVDGLIGMFGSGTKHAISVMLRNNLPVFIMIGNLRMMFFTVDEVVDGRVFHRVHVKYQGVCPITHKTKNNTEALGWMMEWGEPDWGNNVGLAGREFVSNAIDGTLKNGSPLSSLQIEWVDENQVRAKKGHTAVYLPECGAVHSFHDGLNEWFLHFRDPQDLKKTILRKRSNDGKLHVYRNGVLVLCKEAESAFDYNVGSSLKLNESRVASWWDVRHEISNLWRNGTAEQLATLLQAAKDNEDLWELDNLDENTLKGTYDRVDEGVKKNWQKAYAAVYGESVAISSDSPFMVDYITKKGHVPVVVPKMLYNCFSSHGVRTSMDVLTGVEQKGKEEYDATPEVVAAHDEMWSLLEKHDMTNGRSKPPVRCFMEIMDSGSQCLGEYIDGICYIHKDIGGDDLYKVVLEEMVHHVTGAGDMSRDIQDYLFRLVVKVR